MKICHQPFTVNACAGRIEVRKRPSVGTSQSTPSTIRTMLTGARIVKRISFAGDGVALGRASACGTRDGARRLMLPS